MPRKIRSPLHLAFVIHHLAFIGFNTRAFQCLARFTRVQLRAVNTDKPRNGILRRPQNYALSMFNVQCSMIGYVIFSLSIFSLVRFWVSLQERSSLDPIIMFVRAT